MKSPLHENMADIISNYNPIIQTMGGLSIYPANGIKNFSNKPKEDLNKSRLVFDPPKMDITIIDRSQEMDPSNRSHLRVKSQCRSIQEFLNANLNHQRLNKKLTQDSDEEWTTNIFNGELTITEVFGNRTIVDGHSSLVADIENMDDLFNRYNSLFETYNVNSVLDVNDDEYVGNCLEMCEVVYEGGEDPDSTTQCGVCDYKSKYPSKVKVHMRKHTGEKPFACDLCDYRSSKSYSVKAHRRTHTGERPYVCTECSFACNDPSTLRRHKYTHSGIKPFSCPHCQYKCTRSTHLKRHLLTHQTDGQFTCTICGFESEGRNALKAHMMEHAGKPIHTCKECLFTTEDRSTLKRHSLIHSGEKPYSCNLCDYRCRRGAHLRRHMKSHEKKDKPKDIIAKLEQEIKPLICPECGWAGPDEASVETHICNISDQEFFYCNRCDFVSKSLSSLKMHKTTHSGKIYPCALCSRKFQDIEALNEHIIQHSRKKKHTCNECNYSTDFSSSIRKHRLNHTGNFPFKCDQCSYTAKREPNLERHKEIHKNNPLSMADENKSEKEVDSDEDINPLDPLSCSLPSDSAKIN